MLSSEGGSARYFDLMFGYGFLRGEVERAASYGLLAGFLYTGWYSSVSLAIFFPSKTAATCFRY